MFKSAVDQHEIVSFDIYDTAIVRPYLEPSDVFLHVEHILNVPGYARERDLAEKNARARCRDEEIDADAIAGQMDAKYRQAFEYELEFEKQIARCNASVHELYEYALKQGKRVVFVSDMYLPEANVRHVLSVNGYSEYERLYLSSKHKKRKSTGALFRFMLDDLAMEPADVLHIGDNRRSDVQAPSALGITALECERPVERFLAQHPSLARMVQDMGKQAPPAQRLTLSLMAGLSAVLSTAKRPLGYWERFGALVAGPLLYGFTQWVHRFVREKGIRNVLFVARDGYTLIRIFEMLDSKGEFNARYVYLPRYVSETACFRTKFSFRTTKPCVSATRIRQRVGQRQRSESFTSSSLRIVRCFLKCP
jgi:HAD superfamily hydrolase (TIGR01549 family)